ncbi:MAG: hypothetical protein HY898_33330 [Deltaproteobacteria bacterium]|nr:hypothetical protein [Deltaproteobacteria bacterium]
MKRLTLSSSAVAAAGLTCLLAQSACDTQDAAGRRATGPQPEARELVTRIKTSFLAPVPGMDGKRVVSNPVLAPSVARGFDLSSGAASPYFASDLLKATPKQASVTLPQSASGAFRLSDNTTGMAIEVVTEGADPSRGTAVDGYMVYRNAVASGTAHVVHRLQPDGTEDYVLFESAPQVPQLRYGVTLAKGVAGLRLVSDTLEFIDDAGVPRLRMAAPYLVGARGERQMAAVDVQGCEVDRSVVPPWGRAPVAPKASSCTVVVRWGSAAGMAEPSYPALLDPAWTLTGNMTVKRYFHTATLLGDGRVLVAGGRADNFTVHLKAELYSPTSGTFTTTANMSTGRTNQSAVVLADGRVMITGGVSGGGSTLNSAEAFDPNNATWVGLAAMKSARSNHTTTALPSGEVLAAGGEAGATLQSAELYNTVNNTWVLTQNMQVARLNHTATLLDNGKVLVTGGENPGMLSSAELYFRTFETWTLTPAMSVARSSHTATAMDNNKVLIAGGDGSPVVIGAQVYNAANNTWEAAPDMSTARRYHAAAKLLNGRVVVSGGYTTSYLTSSEMFDPGNPGWSPGGDMKAARIRHTATTLNNGKVLVTGGLGTPGGLQSAELFELQKNGLPCQANNECTTGYCVDNVCCDAVCNSTCMACSAAVKGQGQDGVCGAIKDGTDPRDECESLGTGTCQTTGNCDGNGGCGTQSGMQCQASLCIDGTTQQNASTCDANGACNPNGTSSCMPYLCVGNACLTSCTTSADCIPTSACVLNVCVPPGANGSPCGGNIDCTSKNCVESVCCDSPCGGTCQSCREAYKDQGPDGTCGAAKVGLACGATSCINGIQSGPQCTSTSTCETTSAPCAPYLCADVNVCSVTCTTDAQCKSGNYCTKTGKCQPKGNLGGICKEGKECLSGFCVDWVCCDKACGGNVANDCNGCSMAVGASADGTCSLLDNTACGVNGLCSGGVCLENAKDAATDKPVDSPADAPLDTSIDGPADAPADTSKDAIHEGTGDAPVPPQDGAAGGAQDGAAGSTPGETPPASGDSGGCGCRTQSSSTHAAAWLAMIGAASLMIRRRRRS